MKSHRQFELIIYRLLDWLTSTVAWLLFFAYRKRVEQRGISWEEIFDDPTLYKGLILIPIAWLLLYSVFDKYQDIYRYSRLATFSRTFALSLAGTLIIFFTILIDDTSLKYTSYLSPFLRLFCLHFGLTVFARMVFLSLANRRLKEGLVSYNTILIGGDNNAVELYKEITSHRNNLGHRFLGFIDSNGNTQNFLEEHLSCLGQLNELRSIIETNNIEEVIIAIDIPTSAISFFN